MGKQEFLTQLRGALAGLPQEDMEERLSFYEEMIDDRMEEGVSEEEAVAGAGSISDIVSQTVAEVPLTKIVRERIQSKRSLRAWEIVLIVLGFPVWFPLLLAAVVVALALYLVLWVLILCLWVVEIALWTCALSGLVLAAFYGIRRNIACAAAALGAGLACAGLSVFLLGGCAAASKGVVRLTKNAALSIKNRFVGKERIK